MCLILLAWRTIPGHPWVLLGNRDEFHARPSAAAAVWADAPEILGGRDLEAGGSWLALSRNGRFAAVTNVRTGGVRRGARSRGALVTDFVRGAESPGLYVETVALQREDYGPFNLLVGDPSSAFAASSTAAAAWRLDPGVHVFSNGPPGVLWPKARRLRDAFLARLGADGFNESGLLDLLGDTDLPADSNLPDTGVGMAQERFLAPIFIRGSEYGTRASTLAYARDDGRLVLRERRFGAHGIAAGETRLDS
jgi:uncharacterized protein with NRDE domain